MDSNLTRRFIMTNNQPSTDKGNSGRAAQSNFPQRDDTTQSDYSLSQSSEKQTRDSRYSVAEEQNFDEQSDQARRVGRMPQDIGDEEVTAQASPSEAVATTVREKSPETADPQPEATKDDPALKKSIDRAVPPSA